MPTPLRLAAAARGLAVPLLVGLLSAPVVRAIPRLDLTPYPKPSAAEKRWVIQLPGVLEPGSDPSLSADPADWKVELIVGREMTVDCNGPRLNGRIRSETLQGLGYRIYRVSKVAAGPSTRMVCPPDQGPHRAFVTMGTKPFVLPYNASLPIVIYAPKDLQVRWRLWKAERQQRNAQAL